MGVFRIFIFIIWIEKTISKYKNSK